MKTFPHLITAFAVCAIACTTVQAESVHQTLKGEDAKTGDGKSALAEKVIETKSFPDGVSAARVVGSMNQWGYVNYWFGLAAPPNQTTIQVQVYNDGGATAAYAFYVKRSVGDPLVLKLEIPADAPMDSVVTVELPVDNDQEWNGLALKKIDSSDNPSPWIQSVSILKP